MTSQSQIPSKQFCGGATAQKQREKKKGVSNNWAGPLPTVVPSLMVSGGILVHSHRSGSAEGAPRRR